MASKSEWRALSRALRPNKRMHDSSGWGELAGWAWRHLPELLLLAGVAVVWREMAGLVGWLVPLLLPAAAVAGGIAWAPSRRVLAVIVGWRLTRHRLRAGLVEARVTSASGRLPVYLAAWPTSVGERVWLWCPPGVSAEDIEDETDRLRAACIAREVRVNRDLRWSALVTVDVIRRDTLSARRVIPAPITAHLAQDGQAGAAGGPSNTSKPSNNAVKEEVKTSE